MLATVAAMQLRLATSPRFVHADARETDLALRDAALLAWLALEGPTPRTRLAVLLWPRSAPDVAGNALRQRLFQLRRQLGVELVSGHTTLALADGLAHDLGDSQQVLGDAGDELGPRARRLAGAAARAPQPARRKPRSKPAPMRPSAPATTRPRWRTRASCWSASDCPRPRTGASSACSTCRATAPRRCSPSTAASSC